MLRDTECCYQRVSRHINWEFRQIESSSLLKVSDGFLDCLPLRGSSSFGIHCNIATLFGRCKYGSQFHWYWCCSWFNAFLCALGGLCDIPLFFVPSCDHSSVLNCAPCELCEKIFSSQAPCIHSGSPQARPPMPFQKNAFSVNSVPSVVNLFLPKKMPSAPPLERLVVSNFPRGSGKFESILVCPPAQCLFSCLVLKLIPLLKMVPVSQKVLES